MGKNSAACSQFHLIPFIDNLLISTKTEGSTVLSDEVKNGLQCKNLFMQYKKAISVFAAGLAVLSFYCIIFMTLKCFSYTYCTIIKS